MTPILTDANALRSNASRRSFTLSEQYPAHLTCPLTWDQIKGVVEWLDVENSARWQPTANATYCNVYAHDLLHILGFYLPRVWWYKPDDVDRDTPIIYAETVREMSANSLVDWMRDYGCLYGWETSSVPPITHKTNPVVCIAKARKGSGHVVVRFGDKATQAGRVNKQWFPASEFRPVVGRTYSEVIYGLQNAT